MQGLRACMMEPVIVLLGIVALSTGSLALLSIHGKSAFITGIRDPDVPVGEWLRLKGHALQSAHPELQQLRLLALTPHKAVWSGLWGSEATQSVVVKAYLPYYEPNSNRTADCAELTRRSPGELAKALCPMFIEKTASSSEVARLELACTMAERAHAKIKQYGDAPRNQDVVPTCLFHTSTPRRVRPSEKPDQVAPAHLIVTRAGSGRSVRDVVRALPLLPARITTFHALLLLELLARPPSSLAYSDVAPGNFVALQSGDAANGDEAGAALIDTKMVTECSKEGCRVSDYSNFDELTVLFALVELAGRVALPTAIDAATEAPLRWKQWLDEFRQEGIRYVNALLDGANATLATLDFHRSYPEAVREGMEPLTEEVLEWVRRLRSPPKDKPMFLHLHELLWCYPSEVLDHVRAFLPMERQEARRWRNANAEAYFGGGSTCQQR